jgi:hypothetical protein
MNVATAEGVVDHETCEATLIGTSDQLLAAAVPGRTSAAHLGEVEQDRPCGPLLH